MRRNHADRASRDIWDWRIQKRGGQARDQLHGDAVIRAPGGEKAGAEVRLWMHAGDCNATHWIPL